MSEMTQHEEEILEKFFEEGQFIVAPGLENEGEYGCYLWEDYEAANTFVVQNPDVHCYTLIDVDDEGYIIEGFRWVNRFAYLISVNPVEVPGGEMRFW